ncbi:hypothetical protein J3R82DRAFT_6634 [Butyriboletus roseoflavus]|nr:hypothetical protein J3R82DRAFT_6634 [Butyriboletus roseoflavus]
MAQAQSLIVVNQCGELVFLYTRTSFGTIANNVNVTAGTSVNMNISSNWEGAVNAGTGCDSTGSCITGGPTWDGDPLQQGRIQLCDLRHLPHLRLQLLGWRYPRPTPAVTRSPAPSLPDASSLVRAVRASLRAALLSLYAAAVFSLRAAAAARTTLVPGPTVISTGTTYTTRTPSPTTMVLVSHVTLRLDCVNMGIYARLSTDGYQPADLVDYTCPNTEIALTLCPGFSSDYR